MIEAIAAHIAMLRQEGQPVPEPSEAASVTIFDPAAA
jgi:predicted RNase H-like HicB family nuclease